MTDCPNGDIRDLLPDLLNGHLAPQQRGEVEAHLRLCDDCRAEVELLRGMRRSMHRVPSVPVGGIVSALPAYRAPARRVGNGWRIAAALLLVAGGGTSIIVAHDAGLLQGERAQLAVAPAVPREPTSAGDVPRTSPAGTAASASAAAVPAGAAGAPRELAVASASVGDLSEAELDALVRDLESLDAITPGDVEQGTSISPISPSTTSGSGA